MKIQTLDEMEAENPDVFKNFPVTPAEEARNQKRWEAQRIANESLPLISGLHADMDNLKDAALQHFDDRFDGATE